MQLPEFRRNAKPAPQGSAPQDLPLGTPDGTHLQAWAQLAVAAVVGVSRTAEHLHRSISAGALPWGKGKGEQTQGLTGLVYQSVRGTTRVAGWGVEQLAGLLPVSRMPERHSQRRDALLAALNGVCGDYLAETGNRMAIPMSLRPHGPEPAALVCDRQPPQVPAPQRRLLVLVHGLCMNQHQWERQGHNHGQALAAQLNMTALYLHYNTGLHVSTNGQAFAAQLEQLVSTWPVPVEEIYLMGHSMGGLVCRSACHYATLAGHRWLSLLQAQAFLGTPHHGAPTERGGHLLDNLLQLSPYLAPFARLTRLRSAGITDLRFGFVQDADWQTRPDRPAQRHITPLPSGVATYLIAAITAQSPARRRNRLLGDGLVPLSSAWGEDLSQAHTLTVPAEQKTLVTGANHWDLLNREEVYQKLLNAFRVPARTGRHSGLPTCPVQ